MMWHVVKFVLLLGAGLATLPAAAQAVPPTLAPSLAVQCLTPPPESRGKPEYPEDLLARKQGGQIPVELVFSGPDEAPFVRLIDDNALSGLIQSVRAHAKTLRVPCMKRGDEPVRLVQEYVFEPNDGRKVMASTPRDSADAERRAQLACMMRITAGLRPDYPRRSQELGEQGSVYVRLRFVSPTEAPEATVVAAPREMTRLVWSVKEFAAGYRLPCLKTGAVDANMVFKFWIEGAASVSLNDLPLVDLLRTAEVVPRPAYFDTTTMGCPFDVRLEYYQPHSPNFINEVETSNPARKPFLDWLAGITLRLEPQTNTKVLGETMTVSVPCLKIDL